MLAHSPKQVIQTCIFQQAQRFRRGICYQMDELQRDLMQEQWELLVAYNEQLRSYVTLFTSKSRLG